MKSASQAFWFSRHKTLLAVARVLLFMLCCTAVLIATSALPLARSGKNSLLLLGVVSSVGAFLVTCLFARWDSLSLTSVGASLDRGSIPRLAFGLVIGSTLLGVQWAFMWACGHIRWEFSQVVSHGTFAAMIAAFLLLSAREELAFHGFALRRLQTLIGLWPAQIGIAIVFALEHVVGGNSLAPALAGAGMGSLLFGMAAIATRGLAVPIGIHAAWNIGDWLRGAKENPGIWRPVVEPGYESYTQVTGFFTYMTLMALATFAFWLVYCARRSNEA